ncbi:MAG: hypothetical protein GYA62_02820 [Bacteroidales bacterium]|nr:hypothetical protein [Bacteroidales bacterium]
MKNKIFFYLIFALAILSFPVFAQDTEDKTNDFYDNTETVSLPFSAVEIAGEVGNPQKIDLTSLPLRSVIVKEAVLNGAKDTFVGAYR